MSGGDPFDEVLGPGQGSGHRYDEPSTSTSAEFEVSLDPMGRIVRATAIGAGGRRLVLSILRGTPEDGSSECQIAVGADDLAPILIYAGIRPSAEVASFQLRSVNSVVSWVADFSTYDETHLGVISGELNGFPVNGVFDPRINTSTVRLVLEDWLDPVAVARLRYFEPVFRRLANVAGEERADFEDVIRRTIHNSRWAVIGRAACWGLGSMAGGLCCIAAPGIGCVVGLGAFGVASSVCSDLLGPALDRIAEEHGPHPT